MNTGGFLDYILFFCNEGGKYYENFKKYFKKFLWTNSYYSRIHDNSNWIISYDIL